ncbi:hypothetical protein [Quadrisphaera sp. DSM 44207]|uniref:MFS transporter small subunit n=1 Tax=Quadrisphaera sp. DSM 44207 TaxID=1881057 RepID=UPI00088008C0|nr:hypothetical protein [Quadrisphaera sp. DSM 44207]SDQ11492.1 hypothetical protein SAMN05428996_0607 [Quadrisphaera sp. DSM 44207]
MSQPLGGEADRAGQSAGRTTQQTGQRTGQHAGQQGGAGAAKGAAVALWVIVGGALAYGVSQTVIRASQLFS